MLFNEEVSISLGSKIIVKNSLITIDKNIKYCIIGPNGVGKTTVLNHIYENIKTSVNALYITQVETINDNCVIFEYMLKADVKLYEKYIKHKYLEENNIYTDEYNKLSEELHSDNFEKYKAKIYKILHGLGFIDNIDKQINLLSGGQHTKLSLCKALLLEPELLLLDEPTNHLDLNNIIWLQNYLNSYKKGFIVISHNIDFFDSICDKIIYFFNLDPQNPSIYTCNGGYANFLKTFEQQKLNYNKEYDKYVKKVSELKKNKDKTLLEKFIQKNPQINRPIKDYDISIKFNDVGSLSTNQYTNIINFNDVFFSYNNSDNILENINIGVSMKSRYVLIGENGSGKSTFFKLCLKKLQPSQGEIIFDNRIRIGYFNQHSISELDEYSNLNAIQYLQHLDANLDQQQCRAILAKVGFKKMFEGDIFDISKLTLGELSGGQKVKIVMCGIQIKNPHIILFDEPSNHLDIYSINQFIEAINEYNGGIIIITHDKYIIENINDYQLLIMKNKKICKYNGDFEEYCHQFVEDK